MHLFPKAFVLTTLALTAAAGLAVSSAGCGGSGLVKAYDAYDAAVNPLLEREIPLYRKLVQVFNEQLHEDSADPARLAALLSGEAVKFYDEFGALAAAIVPGDPELVPVHATLQKFAASRRAFVRLLEAKGTAFEPGASTAALSKRQNAAQIAVEDYQAAVRGESIVDPRFGALRATEQSFAERCMKPFTEGRMSEQEVSEFVGRNLLPPIRSLRAGVFGEDATSQLLRRAIIASEEFYASFAKHLPIIDQQVKFGAEVTRLTAEGDELLGRFREEMSAIRRRM